MKMMNRFKLFLALCLICVTSNCFAAVNALQKVYFNNLSGQHLRVTMVFEKPFTGPPINFDTAEPPQVIFDFPGITSSLKPSYPINIGVGKTLSSVEIGGRTRVVIALNNTVPYKTKVEGKQIIIDFSGHIQAANTRARPEYKRRQPTVVQIADILDLDFRKTPQLGGEITISLNNPKIAATLKREDEDLIIEFPGVTLPKRLQRKYDVKDFETPVDLITLQTDKNSAIVRIASHGYFEHSAYQLNNKFVVDVNPEQRNSTSSIDLDKNHYTGERVSLNFQNIQVRAVLQLLAEFTGVNLITSDTVDGNITLRLHNVPWDQAMDIILKAKGLDKRESGNVLFVAPAKEIAAQERDTLKAKTQLQDLAPTHSQLIQINYAEAKTLAGLIQSQNANLLSSRGVLNVDQRTNTIWLNDTSEKIAEVEKLIRKLDVPVKQVLIEARVVSIDKTYSQNLGIAWGISNPRIPLSGTLSGANASLLAPLSQATVTDRLNVNLPGSKAIGRIGVALANIGHGMLLDAELSALESEGYGEVIASPRVITANQNTAAIESGEEIPYQQATSSGATSVAFKKAVLGLNVTPQITPDEKIVLRLKVSQDRRSAKPEVLGVPAIDTDSIDTQILVENGGTIVLGGIYKRNLNNTFTRVPFFHKLPLVGNLFKNKAFKDANQELLVFITPKIIQSASLNN